MVTSRETLEIECSSDSVFSWLKTLSLPHMKVSKVDEKNRLVVINTSMSLFSWGERVEIIVIPNEHRCSVSFRSSTRHPINPAADTNTPIRDIIEFLAEKCKNLGI